MVKVLTYIDNPTLAKFTGKFPEMELKETSLQPQEKEREVEA